MNKIIIFNEKHGDRYFDASTTEARDAACLKILTERFEQGYWYEKPEPPDALDVLSDEEIEKLPERLRQPEYSRKRNYERDLQDYEEGIKFYNDVKSTVENKIASNAHKLLRYREDFEYEGFYINELESC